MLQCELQKILISNNIILVTKATKMTRLVYRGIAYIKKDTGRYVKDTPANREILLDAKRFSLKKKSLAAV